MSITDEDLMEEQILVGRTKDRVFAYEGCGNCGNISLRIPHQLLADMLKNCKQSYDRDELIKRLWKIQKSNDLSACLNREGIWKLLDEGMV